MSDLDDERADLAKADLDIAQGEARIARQAELAERIGDRDGGSAMARDLLALLQATLTAWRSHRAQILRRIDYLERERPDPPRLADRAAPARPRPAEAGAAGRAVRRHVSTQDHVAAPAASAPLT